MAKSVSCKTLFVCFILLLHNAALLHSAAALGFTPQRTHYRFDNIGSHQGLGNLEVKAVVQDNEGFIWVGTLDGLYRYNGYEFKSFKYDPDDPRSLPGNVIESLFKDSQGRLWVGTEFAGLALYHQQSESFIRFENEPQNPNSLDNNSIFSLFEDNQGRLWLGSQNGLSRLDETAGTFIHYPLNLADTNTLSKVQAITQDKTGHIWIGTSGAGLNRLDPESGELRHYRHMPLLPDSLSHDKIHVLHLDTHGNLWIGTQGGGLNRYNSEQDNFEHFRHSPIDVDSISGDHVYAIFEDDKGLLWIGTRFNGLNRFDSNRRQFIRYQHNPQDKYSLGDNDVFSISQDRNGLIWLGLFGAGLAKFDPQSARFGMIQYDADTPGSLTPGYIHALYKAKNGVLWVGTESGLNRYNEQTGQFQHFRHEPNFPGSLSDDSVQVINEDSFGNLWIGTQNGGLNRYNPQDSTFTRYQYDEYAPDSLSGNTVTAIEATASGKLWVGTSQGFNLYDPQSDSFTRFFQPYENNLTGLNNINTLEVDKNGSIWLGTHGGGVSHFNPQSKQYTRYVHQPGNANSLSNNTVFSIYEDNRGQLWFGTLQGLNRLNPVSGNFQRFNHKSGLTKDRVNAVLGDSEGYLWLGEGGISRLDPTTGNIKNHIGLQAQCTDTNQGGYFQASDGQLFFASENRLCAFYPAQVLQPSEPPQVVLLDFKLQNKSVPVSLDHATVLSRAINHTQSITLSHEDKLLSFEFAALHYSDPRKNQYQYKLEGFDNEWLETGFDNRRATYSNLSPGTYRFKVKASNHEGIFNPTPRTVSLTVKAPPWASWWAYSLYTALVVVILGAFAYQRNLRQKALVLAKDNAEQAQENADLARINAEKANQAKSAFLANVSHEIRTPLNAVLGHTQILARDSNLNERQRHSLEVIARSSDHLLELINNILDISKIEADEMKLIEEPFELVDLVKGIGIMFQARAREKNLGWEFINDCEQQVGVLGDQGKLRQVLINLLGNALKFTKEGGIILQLSPAGKHSYRFSVLDSGVGIELEHQKEIFKAFGQTLEGSKHGGTGLGLAISYRQVSLMGGTLQVDSKPGYGSHFYFTLHMTPAMQNIDARHNRQLQSVRLNCGDMVKALVVDDVKENRDILCRMLQDVGITVEQAEHGQQALDMLNGAKTLPQLVFMDVRMPVMDGITAVKAIRRQFKEKSPACVVVTAHALRQDVEQYLSLGFDHYIAKPFKFEVIYECIHQLLDVQFQYDEHHAKSPTEQLDLGNVKIPNDIYKALYQGASDYEITKLENALQALDEHSKEGGLLAEHLKVYVSNYDMEGLVQDLEKIHSTTEA